MLALTEKWIAGTITPEERTRLFEWYDRFDDTQAIIAEEQTALFGRLKQEMLEEIRRKIKPPARIRRLARVSVAAAVLLLLATGGWLALHSRTTVSLAGAPLAKNTPKVSDIAPGSEKAILTLADGSTVTLDSAGTGSLTKQGDVEVIKRQGGQLQYASTNPGANPPASVAYNILSTPRGGEYRLKLQDGTNVWLNAASSIRYPTAFAGRERKVEITGEAYFEIAKNADMPFRVSVNDPVTGGKPTEIEVLGTDFNVNAYRDETELRTTLIDGSIKVSNGYGAAVTLKPSQQALVSPGKDIRTTPLENAEQIIAWKNGSFAFDDADIPTIMRQISRWYDVDVQFEGKTPADHFTGTFPRTTSLAAVLQILHTSGVRFMAENKKIVIRS